MAIVVRLTVAVFRLVKQGKDFVTACAMLVKATDELRETLRRIDKTLRRMKPAA